MKSSFHIILVIAALVSSCSTGLTYSDLENQSGRLSHNGFEIQYTVEGSGPPIMVVYGGNLFSYTLSEDIKQKFQWVFIEFFRENTDDVSLVTLDQLTQSIEQVQDKLGLKKVIVAGHSTTGVLAIEYALQKNSKVAGLILVSVPPTLTTEYYSTRERFWKQNASEVRKQLLEKNLSSLLTDPKAGTGGILEKFGLYAPMYWYEPQFHPQIKDSDVDVDPFLADKILEYILTGFDRSEDLHDLKVPVLLIFGQYDFIAPYPLWEPRSNEIANLTAVIFEQSGHFPMIEESEAFNNALLKWASDNRFLK